MFWHFVCSFSQRRNVTLNINCVLAGSKFWSSTTDKEKHRDSSEFHGGGWWSKQKGSHADQQWSICHSYYWRVSILDLVVSDCLPDHICQFLQFYKTTMGSDLNMLMLLMILCFLCLVKLMPSGRKRSHHSCPKINLHPRRKKIQYLMSCSVWSAKILWQMLWLSPVVEIATVMSVSVCTNKYK